MTAVSDIPISAALAPLPAEDDLALYARTGNPAAFERIVRRHLDMVHTFCRRELNGDASLAEDAAQAVFIVLSRKALAQAVPPANRLSGWLFTTARFCCDNLRRSQARRTKHERKAAHMRLETDHTSQSDAETEAQVHQAMARLRDSERQVLLLRFFEKLSLREVGMALNISESAAKFRVSRALKRMSKFLTRRPGTGTAGAMATGALPLWLQANATAAAPQTVVSSVVSASVGQSAAPAVVAAANAAVTGMAVSAAVKVAATVVGSLLLVGGLAVGVATVLPTTGPTSTQPATTPAPNVPLILAPKTPATQPGGVAVDLSTPEACMRSYVNAMRGGDVNAMERCLQYPAHELRPGEMRGAMLIEFASCRLAMAAEQQFGGADKSMYRFPTLRGNFEALVDLALSKLPGPVVPDGNKTQVPIRDAGDELVSQDKVEEIRWYGFWNKTVLHLVRVNDEWKLDTDATLQAMSAIRTRGFLNDQPYKPTRPIKEMADYAIAAKADIARVMERAAADVLNGTLTTPEEMNDRIHHDLVPLFEKQQMLIPRYILMPKTR